MPVASTPIVLRMASGPDSSMTFAMVKTLEIDWIETSDLMSPGGVDLAVGGHQGDAEDLRVDLGERRDVVGVVALLEVLVLGVGGVERGLDLGRRLRRAAGATTSPQHDEGRAEEPQAERPTVFMAFITCLQTRWLKLYLTENWMRRSSEVKPSRKFSRLPHWISGPSITSGVG